MNRSLTSQLATATVALALALPAAAFDVTVDGKLVSTASEGPPLEIASPALVPDLNAALVGGLSGAELAQRLGNVIRLGLGEPLKAAVDALDDATAANPYLVELGPGPFSGVTATLPGHVHLRGAGRDATSLGFPLVVAGPTTIHDLTIDPGANVAMTVQSGSVLRLHDARLVGRLVAHPSVVDVARTSILAPQVAVVLNGVEATFTDAEILGVAAHSSSTFAAGIENNNGSLTLRGSRAGARGLVPQVEHDLIGIFASQGAVHTSILDSVIEIEAGVHSAITGIEIRGGELLLARSTVVARPQALNTADALFLHDSPDPVQVLGGRLAARTCLRNVGGDASFHHVGFECSGLNSAVTSAGATTRLVHTHVDGGPILDVSSGTTVCRFTTDEDFVTSTSACP